MQPILAIYALWLFWFLCWLASAMLDGRAKKLTFLQDAVYRCATIVGMVTLLFGFLPDPGFDVKHKLWQPLDEETGWVLAGVAFVAFCISLWARICLGFALPGSTKKHREFAETGPYRLIRHPIYFSVTAGAFATACVFGKLSSLGGAILLAIAFLVKILIEEDILRGDSGAYEDYAERVPMLIPFLPKRGNRLARAASAPKPVRAFTPPAPPSPATIDDNDDIFESAAELPPVIKPADAKPAIKVEDQKLGSDLGLTPAARSVQLSLLLDELGGDPRTTNK